MEITSSMKKLLLTEEVLLFLSSIILFGLAVDYSWWFFALLFFLPDISFLGYLVNTKTGAWFYNTLHHRGIMIACTFAGYYLDVPILLAIGIIFFGHASFDRIFGYGLKYTDSFHHTHLGRIGK